MGAASTKAIELLTPSLPCSAVAAQITLAAVLAVEVTASPGGGSQTDSELTQLADELAGWTHCEPLWCKADHGMICAMLRGASVKVAAREAARLARHTVTLGLARIELRCGLAVGLIDERVPVNSGPAGQATRLARAAPAGRVLLSYAVARELQDIWRISPAGPAPRRAEDRGEPGLTLLDPREPEPAPSALVKGRHPRLVGRRQQLTELRREWRSATRGAGRWCGVLAPAGGGKSALLQHWLAQSDEPVLAVGASPFGAAPMALAGALARQLSLDPPDERSEDAVIALDLAHALAKRAPLRVLFEDVHWTDQRSLAVMRELSEITPARCLLVCAYRVSFEESMRWMPGSRIRLPGLDKSEREELLRTLLPDRASGTRELLCKAKAAASPLFLEQAAALVREQPRPERLPETIAEAVLQRLQLVRSAISRSFPAPDIAELDRIEGEIGEWLDRLETGDYADRETIARSLALLEGIDSQLVIARSIAGATLSRNRRVAEAVQRFYAASFAERVRALEAIAIQEPLHAAQGALSGARAALQARRLTDARAYLRCAASWHPDPARAARALGDLGDLLMLHGEGRQASSAYRQAAAASAGRPPADEYRRRQARAQWVSGDLEGAHGLLRELHAQLSGEQAALAECDLATLASLLGHTHVSGLARLANDGPGQPMDRSVWRALVRGALRAELIAGSLPDVPLRVLDALLGEAHDDPVHALAELIETVALMRHLPCTPLSPQALAAAEEAARAAGGNHARKVLNARHADWAPLHPKT